MSELILRPRRLRFNPVIRDLVATGTDYQVRFADHGFAFASTAKGRSAPLQFRLQAAGRRSAGSSALTVT